MDGRTAGVKCNKGFPATKAQLRARGSPEGGRATTLWLKNIFGSLNTLVLRTNLRALILRSRQKLSTYEVCL